MQVASGRLLCAKVGVCIGGAGASRARREAFWLALSSAACGCPHVEAGVQVVAIDLPSAFVCRLYCAGK